MTDISLRYLLFGEDKTASTAIKGTGTQAQKTSKIVGKAFAGLGSAIGGPIGEAVSHVQNMFSELGGTGATMGQKLTGAGVGVAGLGAGLSILGSHEKEATNSLQAALGTTGHSIDDYKSQIEETIKTQENYNHSAADTQQALATLTEATGDPTKAFDSMQLAANLAAAKHIDLNSAAAMVAKTLGGSTRLMTQYGVVVEKNADGSKNMDLAISQLSGKLQGQAAASVDSYSGKLKVLETKVHDQISLWGQKFGPVLQAGGVALALVGTVTQIVANRQLMAAAATEAQAAAQVEATAATEAETVAQGELDAAMDANPVGLLVIAIAALVAGLVIFFTKTKLGRAIVSGALHDMGDAAGFLGHAFSSLWHGATAALNGVQHGAASTYGWVHDHWPLLLAILTGPFGLATLFIVGHWHQITGAAGSAVSSIHGKLDQLVGFVTGMPGRIESAASGMFGGITNAFRSAINGVIDIWNGLSFTVPGVSAFGHHVGGFTISTPDIRHLAAGGTLMSSGSVIVGDRGLEQLTLPAGASVRPLSAREARGAAGGDAGILGVFAVDLRLDGRVVQRLLLKLKRENGGLTLGLA